MTMSKYDYVYGFALPEWDRSQSNPALNIQSGSVCSAPALLTQDELHVVQARSVHAEWCTIIRKWSNWAEVHVCDGIGTVRCRSECTHVS